MVRRWNGLRNGDSLRGRKVLALHLPVTPSTETALTASKSPGHTRKTTQTASAKVPAQSSAKKPGADASGQAAVLRHKVKSGETLYSIATTYKTTVAALKRNNGNIAVLRPGMILVVQPSR
jgi:LysM repeat protein